MRLPVTPLSNCYGYDRGTPIDRPYIHHFLSTNTHHIHGDGLEVKDNTYLRRFGADRIHTTTVIDVDPNNPHATLRADLSHPGALPATSFDCILLTQTLQLLAAPATALATCWRALRPGGTLLITVPCLARISPSGASTDRWRFTPRGLGDLLTTWTGTTTITSYGNLRTCLAALLGEAAEELTDTERTPTDPAFPLLACAAAHRT